MYGDSPVVGHGVQGEVPEWRPLLDAGGEYLAETFMWMFEVRLSDGRPLHAYKHIETRRYVHLDPACNAFRYVGENYYRLNASVEDVVASWHAIARALRDSGGSTHTS